MGDDADAHLRETAVEARQVFRGKLLDVRCDTVRLPDGALATREYIAHPGAVMVVPILADGRLVLERQWRHPLGRATVEFPAGKIDPGEDTFACARRELIEETGYRAAEWALAGTLHNAVGYSSEGIVVWFARGLTLGDRALDEGEFVDVFTLGVDELASRVQRGEVTDAKTLIGLLWLQNWLAGRWPLPWQPAA
jgi:ADP-ribose pyrophosphatase